MIYPVKHIRITSPYGERSLKGFKPVFHKGVDFTGRNSLALAVCDLKIEKVLLPDMEYPCLFEYNVKTDRFGRINGIPSGRAWTPYVIAIPTDEKLKNIKVIYKHVNSLVTTGNIYPEGYELAEVGNYGYSMGSHLHFEILKDGKNINPIEFLVEHMK